MGETLAQTGCAMPEPFFGMEQRRAKMREISSTKVFQFAPLEQIPHPFLWIQCGRISRQALQMNACGSPCRQKVFDDARAMDGRAIPDNQQFPRNFAKKPLQKAHHIWPFIRMILKLHEQPPIWGQSPMAERWSRVSGTRRIGV